MSLRLQDIVFQILAFLLAISVHESAHGWTAWRLGDPTAYDRGRVSLNPLRHIDPVGTLLLPMLMMILGLPAIGWARPTPVNPRNFSHYMRDDILTSVAGPVSNFLSAAAAAAGLLALEHLSPAGRPVVSLLVRGSIASAGLVSSVALALYNLMQINVLLGTFNLIPIPPLDGSHVLRHLVPPRLLPAFNRLGLVGLIVFMLFGGRLLTRVIHPVIAFFNRVLLGF